MKSDVLLVYGLAWRSARVAWICLFLLATLGLSSARAQQIGVPVNLAGLQRDIRMLQQQAGQLLEHESEQNKTITQLAGVVNTQSRLIAQLQQQNQDLLAKLGCTSASGCDASAGYASAMSTNPSIASSTAGTQSKQAYTSHGGILVGDLSEMSLAGTADGKSQLEGVRIQTATSGPNDITQVLATHAVAQQLGSGMVQLVRGSHSEARVDGSGVANTLIGASAQVAISGTAQVQQAQVLRVVGPEIGSGASIGTIEGMRIANIANPHVTDVYGVRVQDQNGSGGTVIGLRSELTGGPNKWNIYQTGSAPNALEALTIFGTDRGVQFENQQPGSLSWGRPPDFLLKIIINGTQYLIPCWRG